MQSKYRLLSRQEQTIFLIYFTNQTKIKPPLVNSSSYIHLKHEPTSKKKTRIHPPQTIHQLKSFQRVQSKSTQKRKTFQPSKQTLFKSHPRINRFTTK